MSYTSLARLIPRLFFEAIVKRIVSPIYLSSYIYIYIEVTDCCVFILFPATFLKVFITLRVSGGVFAVFCV